MPNNAITSSDTLTLYDRVFTDLANGQTVNITFPNESVNVSTGKKGNGILAQNAEGKNATMTLRLLRGSADDRFLQAKQRAADADFAAQELASGTFVKRMGDGEGGIRFDTYTLRGGTMSRYQDAIEDVSGDVEQAVAVYNFKFINATRSTK